MIEFLILNSFWIYGVNCLFSEDYILEKWGDWMEENLPKWIYKPTVGCASCMASFHGTAGYFIFVNEGFLIWPIYCVCLCGLNFVIIKLTTKERIIVEE